MKRVHLYQRISLHLEEIKKLLERSKNHHKILRELGGLIKSVNLKCLEEQFASGSKSPAWQRKEGKSESGGLNRKGIASYRAANPGSKLSMAVTTKPSKLKERF
jgi:hypothetical protein